MMKLIIKSKCSIKILRNKRNQIVGKLKKVNSVISIYDVNEKYIGKYNVKTDKTYDKKNRFIGYGNFLTTLLITKEELENC